jgi:hypothetical protein
MNKTSDNTTKMFEFFKRCKNGDCQKPVEKLIEKPKNIEKPIEKPKGIEKPVEKSAVSNDVTLTVNDDGVVKRYKDRLLHNLAGPAIESSTWEEWYKNGKPHRVDGPAFKNIGGSYVNAVDGKIYEIYNWKWDATVYCDGSHMHNESGPAMVFKKYNEKYYRVHGRELQGSDDNYNSVAYINNLPRNPCENYREAVEFARGAKEIKFMW